MSKESEIDGYLNIKVAVMEKLAETDFEQFRQEVFEIHSWILANRKPVNFDFKDYVNFDFKDYVNFDFKDDFYFKFELRPRPSYFLYTLLFETLRLSWALRVENTVENISNEAKREFDWLARPDTCWRAMKLRIAPKEEISTPSVK